MSNRPRLAVIIASLNRPRELADVMAALARQTVTPDRIILSVTKEEDLPPAQSRQGAEVIIGPKGSCHQRNSGIEAVIGNVDYIAFFDDDYLPSKFACERMVDFLETHADLAGINGHLIADGINGPGISREEAEAMIAEFDARPAPEPKIGQAVDGLYGCNMAYRASMVQDARFDENLPLYAWQEDIDFAAQLLPRGRLVQSNAFAGVHRGVKGGRTSGVRLGYSQVANPLYLMKKGTMRKGFGWKLMLRNIASNHVKAFRPEPWVDRWGRVKGNWLAFRHALTGKLRPDHILKLG